VSRSISPSKDMVLALLPDDGASRRASGRAQSSAISTKSNSHINSTSTRHTRIKLKSNNWYNDKANPYQAEHGSITTVGV